MGCFLCPYDRTDGVSIVSFDEARVLARVCFYGIACVWGSAVSGCSLVAGAGAGRACSAQRGGRAVAELGAKVGVRSIVKRKPLAVVCPRAHCLRSCLSVVGS